MELPAVRFARAYIVAGVLAAAAVGLLLATAGDGPPADAVGATAAAPVAVARGRVDVEGGVVLLAAQRDGVVRAVTVEEGDTVRKDQVLAVLEDRQARLNVALTASEFDAAAAQIAQIQVELETAERDARRLELLLADHAVARVESERARDQARLAAIRLRSARAAHAAAQARVRIAEHEVELRAVRAPFDGRIVRRQVRPGDGVSTLNVTPLFWFAPDTPRIVRAELEESYAAAVMPGMPAEVALESDDAQRFGARVVRVGALLGPKRPVTDDPYERADVRVVECVLLLEPAAQGLLLGQRVLVRFQQAPTTGG